MGDPLYDRRAHTSALEPRINLYKSYLPGSNLTRRAYSTDSGLEEFYASDEIVANSFSLKKPVPRDVKQSYRMSHLFKPVRSDEFNIFSMSELSDQLETQLEYQSTAMDLIDLGPDRPSTHEGHLRSTTQTSELQIEGSALSGATNATDEHLYGVASVPDTPNSEDCSIQPSESELHFKHGGLSHTHDSIDTQNCTQSSKGAQTDLVPMTEPYTSHKEDMVDIEVPQSPDSDSELYLAKREQSQHDESKLPSPSEFKSQEITRCLSQRFRQLLISIVAENMQSGRLSGSVDTYPHDFYLTCTSGVDDKALQYQKERIRRAIVWSVGRDQWDATAETRWSVKNQLLGVTYKLSFPGRTYRI